MALLMLLLAAAAPPAPAADVKTSNAALQFEYSWPRAAAAIPVLNRRFQAEAQRTRAKAQHDAGEDLQLAKADKREFHPHEFSWGWEVAGQTPRLLSLEANAGFYTGGAHPNHTTQALLWDRRSNREISIDGLFLRPTAFAALTRADYCKALAKERAKRRQGEKLGGEFDDCPKFSELAILPLDSDGNGRFDRFRFVASPYVAGPYAEGDYELELPLAPRLINAVKPLFRNAFEAQRQ